jgi:serine-type D-Ala-D-Ala carboxypeptidase/endopeptidase (penicillin-binding protein 4)
MMKTMMATTLALLLAAPVQAKDMLEDRVAAKLAETGPGTRYGLVVTTMDGREIVAIRPTDRFIPASNTKMFTTAAAFDTLKGLDQPDTSGGAQVRLEGRNVVLVGRGDARLSSKPDCLEDCLAVLADAVATRTKRVGDVIGDDSLFPDERWSPGMSWNNIPTRSGTATSALTLDDNELAGTVTPGKAGEAPAIAFALPYYTIENRVVTVAEGKTEIDVERMPNTMLLRVTGTILAAAEPETMRVGIDDPAYYAAWRMKTLLEARGVRVKGKILSRHHGEGALSDAPVLATLTPPPLAADLVHINKVSQNLHSELALRRVGAVAGTGSIRDGQAQIHAMLARAGVPRTAYDLSDGSGMSTYNRVAPRGMTVFLRWIAAQPWAAAYRATLPIAGVDGTLSRRFKGTSLEGKLFAKTGTINATNGLSGYMTTKSGKTLIFSAYANDVPENVSALPAMDAALVMIAEAN